MKTTYENDTMTKETGPLCWTVAPNALRFYADGREIVTISLEPHQMRALGVELHRAGRDRD